MHIILPGSHFSVHWYYKDFQFLLDLEGQNISKFVEQPMLQNMNFKTHKNETKSKRWALYLKIWAIYGNFCESRLDEISISQNFQILKSHSIFEVFAQFIACELKF